MSSEPAKDLAAMASGPPQVRQRKFDGLEAGRGLAALAVLLSHINLIMSQHRFYGLMPCGGLFMKFGAGVDFFFVLSGFIIAWAHWYDLGQPRRLLNYAARRFLRIYPAYWAVLLPLSLAYVLAPGAGEASQHDPINFLFSFLLLPYTEHPILGVAWTLVFEVMFYCFFALLIAFGRPAFAVLALWAILVVVANLLLSSVAFPLSVLADVHNIEFLMGMGAAAVLRRRSIPAPSILAIVGTFLFVAQMLDQQTWLDQPLVGRFGYGLAAVIGMMGIVELERRHRLAIPRAITLLGAASYSVYLVHGIVISFGIQVLTRLLPRTVPLALPLVLLTVAGVCAGLTFHLLVEKPLARRLGCWRARRVPVAAPAGH